MRHDGAVIASASVEDPFLRRWVDRLRGAFGAPAVGVLLRGSHARDGATCYSDLDLDVLVTGASQESYPAFLADTGDRLLHISVVVSDVASWFRRLHTPPGWALGLPVACPARLLWAAEGWHDRLDIREVRQPPAAPALEDLVAGLGKLASAHTSGDDTGTRLAAADLARLCPSVLRLANPPVTVACRRQALTVALGLPVAPADYADDMRLCLGLRWGTTAELHAAGRRLVTGIVALVRPYAETLVPVCGPDLAVALTDGRLDRYLSQLAV